MATVIVHAECFARGDSYYTQPSIDAALDVFFNGVNPDVYDDRDAENPMNREDAAHTFEMMSSVTFYNAEGERTVIAKDWSNHG